MTVDATFSCLKISLLKLAFIRDGVKVAVVIRSAEHTIRKEIKPTEHPTSIVIGLFFGFCL